MKRDFAQAFGGELGSRSRDETLGIARQRQSEGAPGAMRYDAVDPSRLQARPMAMPAETARVAISAVTTCGDNAPPASQMTTNATAVASRITTTRSVK